MPLANEPSRVNFRLYDEKDKAALAAEVDRRGMSQQDIMLRLLRRYHSLPNLVQLWFLGQLDKADEPAAADAFGRWMRGKRK